jgi:putative transposase
MPLPLGPNQRWSLDFVHDQMTDGRRLRILAVVDDYSRECLALVADTSIPGIRVARELDRIVAVRGRPGGIVSDNGTELTSTAILAWSDRRKRSPGTTSPQASWSTMPSLRVSMAGCATSC